MVGNRVVVDRVDGRRLQKQAPHRGATEGRHRNLNLLRIIKSINADIPLPPAVLKTLGSVLQNNFVALLDVDLNDERNHKPPIASPKREKGTHCLIGHLLPQCWDVLSLDR